MSVGLLVSKQEIDQRTGDVARTFQGAFNDVLILQTFLSGATDATLTGLGYTTTEVTLLRNAFNDLVQLGLIWTGSQNLTVAKDFRVYVGQLWGVGSL